MDDDDWAPPTEEEMKRIEARRARSDKISKLMAGYLLKGYKMLGTECVTCGTILLQDRSDTKHCVACEELECDTEKDNPAFLPPGAPYQSIKEELRSASVAQTSISVVTTASSLPHVSSSLPKVAAHSPRIPSAAVDDGGEYLSMSSIDVHCWPANPAYLGAGDQQSTVKNAADNSELPTSMTGAAGASRSQNLSKSNTNSSSHGDGMSSTITALERKISWAGQALDQSRNVDSSIELCKLIKAAAEAIIAVRKATV